MERRGEKIVKNGASGFLWFSRVWKGTVGCKKVNGRVDRAQLSMVEGPIEKILTVRSIRGVGSLDVGVGFYQIGNMLFGIIG